jgi:dimethylargininase
MRDTLNLQKAREQHRRYREALSDLGLEVLLLAQDDEHPDSCFVEDTAVVHKKKALICRLAPESRRGEEMLVEEMLKDRLRIRRAQEPATIEGGDVMHLPDRLVSALAQRTNELGVKQAAEWLEVRIDTVLDPGIVHLKSYVTYLGRGKAICSKRFMNHSSLRGLDLLVVPEGEEYAANTLTIDDTVLMPSGRPRADKMVREAGFDVRTLDTSEFEKCEGALTCLSLII